MEHLDALDPASGQRQGQSAADDLDLGKFGHGVLPDGCGDRQTDGSVTGCWDLSAANAVAAAFCSASFLLRPAPGP